MYSTAASRRTAPLRVLSLSLTDGSKSKASQATRLPSPTIPSTFGSVKGEQCLFGLSARFLFRGRDSALSAVWDLPKTCSPCYQFLPRDDVSEVTTATWDESDTDSDMDDLDADAQYIMIYPGSPWYKPARASSLSARNKNSTSSSRNQPYTHPHLPRCRHPDSSAGRHIGPLSLNIHPSGSFLTMSPSPSASTTFNVRHRQQFSRAVLLDPATELDASCLDSIDEQLLHAPHRSFENECRASLSCDDPSLGSSRHAPDVPIDLSDEDEWWF